MSAINTSNNNITFKGETLKVDGPALKVGEKFPQFTLTANDMADLKSDAFSGRVLIISTVPSLDTPTCSTETKRFNQEAAQLGPNVSILTVSYDLPFAQKRWCAAEGVKSVMTASDFKHREFGRLSGNFYSKLGTLGSSGVRGGPRGIIRHVEYVSNLSQEPDYNAALNAARNSIG